MPWTWLALLIGGAVIGWLASIVGNFAQARTILMLIVGGAAAAALGALIFPPIFGTRIDQAGFSLPNLLIALLGAIFLLGGVIIARRMAFSSVGRRRR